MNFIANNTVLSNFASKGISVVGSVGLLKAAVDLEFLKLLEADKLLTKMIRAGYFSPIESISELYSI